MALGDFYSVRVSWSRQHDSLGTGPISWYCRTLTINTCASDVLIHIDDASGQRARADSGQHEAPRGDPKNASYCAQLSWHYGRLENAEQARKSIRLARRLGGFDVLPIAEPDAAGS